MMGGRFGRVASWLLDSGCAGRAGCVTPGGREGGPSIVVEPSGKITYSVTQSSHKTGFVSI